VASSLVYTSRSPRCLLALPLFSVERRLCPRRAGLL
jgi:hypothetical protein